MESPKKKYKRYIVHIVHRGYTVELRCTAKSFKEAAEKFDVSLSYMRSYGMTTDIDEPMDEVMGLIDSGYIVFEPFNRKDLMRKLTPWSELKAIINEYSAKYHEIRIKEIKDNI